MGADVTRYQLAGFEQLSADLLRQLLAKDVRTR
jgi:hypothetical protein